MSAATEAVMRFAPAESPVLVEYVAVHVSELVPPLQVAFTVGPEPTAKVTVPDGATPPPLIVAVSVTFWPRVPATLATLTVGVPRDAVPLSWIVCVEPGTFAELSVVISEPVTDPLCCGVNVITSVQVPLAGMVTGAEELESCGHVELGSKLKFCEMLGLVPVNGADRVRGAVPSFSSVTVCAALVWPTGVLGYVSEKIDLEYTAKVELLYTV